MYLTVPLNNCQDDMNPDISCCIYIYISCYTIASFHYNCNHYLYFIVSHSFHNCFCFCRWQVQYPLGMYLVWIWRTLNKYKHKHKHFHQCASHTHTLFQWSCFMLLVILTMLSDHFVLTQALQEFFFITVLQCAIPYPVLLAALIRFITPMNFTMPFAPTFPPHLQP